eukprot:CAMPEP_0118971710 /NCGR_PEP_ID=MMETSP1173-20130426/8255_1 /TAXON_ID=1034831 /ORGANISM="Rhizochromulina marina cf, Strain CCMP1243" /LENGTH=200 /DNA_ID=CAMNT_0006921189 /DNA_START=15 /DNA_END=617 /DNA_ORIENTATION=-
MKVVAVLALLVAGASAFVASPRAAPSSVALSAKSKALPFLECPPKLDGSMIGDVGFDPMGLSNVQTDLTYARAAELKHGRIAQLAVTGFFIQENFPHLTGVPGYEEMNPLKAPWSVPLGANAQIFLAIGIVELATSDNTYGEGEPGNLGWGTKMLQGKSQEKIDDMKLKEITHCRLAMIAIVGMVVQTLIFDKPLLGGSF